MRKNALILVVIVAALLVSSSAFGQACEKMKMVGGMGEGMHKGCSQMGGMTVEKIVKCCGTNPGMMMKCGEMGHGAMGAGCSGMCGSGGKMSCCKKGFFLCCKEKLELTDEQVASLKSIRMGFLKDKIRKEADLELAELDLKELMSADKLDLSKVEKKIKSIHAMKAEKKIAHLKAFEKAKGILTPEQLKKKKEHHKMMKGM